MKAHQLLAECMRREHSLDVCEEGRNRDRTHREKTGTVPLCGQRQRTGALPASPCCQYSRSVASLSV